MARAPIAALLLMLLLPTQAEPIPEPDDVEQLLLDALHLAEDFARDFNASQPPEDQMDAALVFSQGALDLITPLICEASRTAHPNVADAWTNFYPPIEYNLQRRVLEIRELALEDGEWLVVVHKFRVWTNGIDCAQATLWGGTDGALNLVAAPEQGVMES